MSYWPRDIKFPLMPLKHCSSVNPDILAENTKPDFEFDYIDIGSVSLEHGVSLKQRMSFEGAPSRARKLVRASDVIVSTVRTYLRAIAAVEHSEVPQVASTGFAVFRAKSDVEPRFLYRAVQATPFVEQVVSQSVGVSYPAINPSTLADIEIPLPDLPTQRAIADFLDRETARIDTLIEKKQRLVNVIAEKAFAVVSFAIRGSFTTPDAQKCNDIDWMGEYPAHWKRLPLKALGVGKDAVFIDGDWIESKDLSSEGIRYLTTGNVGIGVYKEQGVGFISQDTFNHLNCTEVLPGDILISRLNPPIGRACLVPQLSSRMVTSVDNVIVRPSSHIDRQFIVHVLTSSEFFENTSNIARGTTMQRISRSALGKIRIPLPPLEEQREIARHVSSRTDAYRLISDKVGLSVDRLKEYRSALITSAVTGQIDVTKWTNAGTTDRQLDAIEEEFGA